MGWELKIWDATKNTLLNTITHNAAGGIVGGFTWQRKPNGDCVQLDMAGINTRLKLGPRSVVQLSVGGTAQFFGIVPDAPHANSPDSESAQALGGREALRLALMDGKVYREMSIFDIVRDILGRLLPPCLTYSAAQVGAGGGPVLSLFYSPTAALSEVLDNLAKSASTTWGVDAQGRVFFGLPAPAPYQVAYTSQNWRRLRVMGRETCTRAVVRVASSLSDGALYSNGITDGVLRDYLPTTVTAEVVDAAHPLYRCSKAFDGPSGVGLSHYLAGALDASTGDVRNAANAVDGNTSTFAVLQALADSPAILSMVSAGNQRVIGARLSYALSVEPTDPRQFSLDIAYDTADGQQGARAGWAITKSNQQRELVVALPPHASLQGKAYKAGIGVTAAPDFAYVADAFKVYELSLLVVDETAAQLAAASFLNVPNNKPAEITIKGALEPPTLQLQATGTPDGDVTGETTLWEYEHSPDRVLTTRIRVGADGQSDTARAIKWAVRT